MKLKDFVVPFLLALITLLGIHYFIQRNYYKGDDKQPRPGQSFKAPTQEEHARPLKRDFAVPIEEAGVVSKAIEIATDYGTLHFSDTLGTLDRINFKRNLSGKERVLTPLASTPNESRSGFIVAVDDHVPFPYQLITKDETKESTILSYRAQNSVATVSKTFTVLHEVPRIDVSLTIEPAQPVQQGLNARLFLPAPYITQADKDYTTTGLVYTDRNRLQTIKLAELLNHYWLSPAVFGAEDRYFVNALIADPDGFTRRAYYTGVTSESVGMVLEGPGIKEAKTWNLSFYLGPKDAHIIEKVDARLDASLDYGWLSPLVKALLALLKFIYKYINNYGWAIILLTLLIRLLLFPITFRSRKVVEKQKEYQRKLQYIEQKYRHDPDMLNKERLELTRKYGVTNVLGCLPQLAQLPLLLGLNRLLSTSVELYQAPFIGWITDLSARDPYYILPLLAGVGLFIQVSSDMDIRRGVTMLLFAAFLVVVTAHLPAGFALYLCANTWFSIAQLYGQKVFKL